MAGGGRLRRACRQAGGRVPPHGVGFLDHSRQASQVGDRAAEEAYFAKTGMFPIMHLIAIRRSLVEQHPWLPVHVYRAYLEARSICYQRLGEVGHLYTMLPWPVDEFDRARELMGDDYWRYGVNNNGKEIEAMTRYAFEQGLTDRKLSPKELFAPSTLDMTGH